MNCQNCGHPKSDHIYEEGACRPGFACSCEKFVPELKLMEKPCRTCGKGTHNYSELCVGCETPEIIPLKSMDPDVAEVLGRICDRLGVVYPGTAIGDELAIVTTVLELRKDLKTALGFMDPEVKARWGDGVRKKWGL